MASRLTEEGAAFWLAELSVRRRGKSAPADVSSVDDALAPARGSGASDARVEAESRRTQWPCYLTLSPDVYVPRGAAPLLPRFLALGRLYWTVTPWQRASTSMATSSVRPSGSSTTASTL